MHSFDRTLLAKLGFDDPDKKDRRHDLACQYLAQPEVANRLAAMLFKKECEEASILDTLVSDCPHNMAALDVLAKMYLARKCGARRNFTLRKAVPEAHIQKGEGKYATTIGFADVLLFFNHQAICGNGWYLSGYYDENKLNFDGMNHYSSVSWEEARSKWVFSWKTTEGEYPILVEVKIQPQDVGSIIRQLNLYRSYVGTIKATIVACAFPLQAEDIAVLAGAYITYLKLGDKFNEYVRVRESAPLPTNTDCMEV